MRIVFSPVRMDRAFALARDGEHIAINGEVFDFAGLAEGASLPLDAIGSDLFAADVERKDGLITVSLMLPYGVDAGDEYRFPVPIEPDAQSTLLSPVPDETSVGAIDWSKMLTAEQRNPAPSDKPSDNPLKRWQFKAMVAYLGVADAIVSAINAMEDPLTRAVVMARYENSDIYNREDPLFDRLAPAVGLTPKKIDAAWMTIVKQSR